VCDLLSCSQWILRQPNVTVFMGCVGRDKYSKILEDKARSEGVNVQYQYTDREPTG
jgi:adenosine kinase